MATRKKTRSSSSRSRRRCLDDDLVREILVRVPLKTLLRSKSVSKSWNRLISDRKFIKIRQSLPPLAIGFFSTSNKSQPRQFHQLHDDINMNLSFVDQKSLISPLAAYQGFVLCEYEAKPSPFHCFRHRNNTHSSSGYLICNPCTNQILKLPNSNYSHNNQESDIIFFCYQNRTSKLLHFKLLALIDYESFSMRMEIYSSNTGIWKEITLPYDYNFDPCRNVVLAKSVYFWEPNSRFFFMYNPLDRFSYSGSFPSLLDDDTKHRNRVLGVSNDSLCYSETTISLFSMWGIDDQRKWSLTYKVALESLPIHIDMPKSGYLPLAFHPLNSNVILMGGARYAFLYHCDDGRIQVIEGMESPFCRSVFPYSLPAWQSLVLNSRFRRDEHQTS